MTRNEEAFFFNKEMTKLYSTIFLDRFNNESCVVPTMSAASKFYVLCAFLHRRTDGPTPPSPLLLKRE